MKKTMVILVMVLVLIVSWKAGVFATNAKAEIKTSSKTVKQGESFTVSLELNDKDLINGLTTEVTYDKNLLEFTKKEISDAFENMADEKSLKFELVANKKFESGEVIKLTFKAKEDVKGNTTVKFNNVWVDSNATTNSETTVGDKETTIGIFKTIKFKDENCYKAIVSELGNKIVCKNDDKYTIGITESIEKLSINAKNIEDISGIENFDDLKTISINNNKIKDISILKKLNKLTSLNVSNQNIVLFIESVEPEIPQILKEAQDRKSKYYANGKTEIKNCKISEDGNKIILNDNENIGLIKINDGYLKDSVIAIVKTKFEIQPKITKANFKKSCEIEISGITKNGQEIGEDGIVSTGTIIKIQDKEVKIIVKGDTNEDGKADFKDMLKINKHRLNKVNLHGEDLTAGDVNKDGKVDFKDILQINKYRLGKISQL